MQSGFYFSRRSFSFAIQVRLWLVIFCLAIWFTPAHADQIVYDDTLQNGWQNWSWATVSLTNPAPVHGGGNSISVSSAGYQALYFHHAVMAGSLFTNLTFWINGGTGAQIVQVQATINGAAQSAVVLAALPANAWRKETISLAALGVASSPAFDGIWIQAQSGSPIPTFYVDDIALTTNVITVGTNALVPVPVDAASNRRTINPLIYGVAFAANSNQLLDLNVPLHRSGGNAETRYNWSNNVTSIASDYYFECLPSFPNIPGGEADNFVRLSKGGNAQPMLTVPIIGWVGKLGPGRTRLASFSVTKYGAQTSVDPYWTDAGNGISSATGLNITNNDPTDANMIVGTNFQAGWVRHLTNTWGAANAGGLRYYLMDNEWSLWNSTHRDVHPVGATMDEVLGKFSDYATMVKGIDTSALVAGPEEWGWPGYLYSGYDQSVASTYNYNPANYPDRVAHGGQDFSPWFLAQLKTRSLAAGKRLIDVFTHHIYPQQANVALSGDASPSTVLARNRSTRVLWDTNYVDESWINSIIALIPRMKNWVATNYPGTLIGITEYNWGADDYMSGATAQADVLGIFGREGLDLATRWTCPNSNTPAYNAIKMFRNYDGNKSVFGDTSVSASVPNPDMLATFAAVRASDGALTVMVINKDSNFTPVALNLTNFAAAGTAQVWQLATNKISSLGSQPFTNNLLARTLPPQSVNLLVLPPLPPFGLRVGANSGGQFTLWLDGLAGQKYSLQSSSNLLQWTSISTNTLLSNSFPYSITTTGSAATFYRGRWTP
jgi:hypothetical protein